MFLWYSCFDFIVQVTQFSKNSFQVIRYPFNYDGPLGRVTHGRSFCWCFLLTELDCGGWSVRADALIASAIWLMPSLVCSSCSIIRFVSNIEVINRYTQFVTSLGELKKLCKCCQTVLMTEYSTFRACGPSSGVVWWDQFWSLSTYFAGCNRQTGSDNEFWRENSNFGLSNLNWFIIQFRCFDFSKVFD